MHPMLENPFFVLELSVDATPVEVERQGRKLLGMLELGLLAARSYPTPLGRRERTADDVRRAMQTLLDPAKRLPFEPWAAGLQPPAGDDGGAVADAPAGEGPTGRAGAAASMDAGGMVWWRS